MIVYALNEKNKDKKVQLHILKSFWRIAQNMLIPNLILHDFFVRYYKKYI